MREECLSHARPSLACSAKSASSWVERRLHGERPTHELALVAKKRDRLIRGLSTFLIFTLLAARSHAQEAKRFYIANDDHTDFMWTADADTYAEKFVDLLDFHLRLAGETANEPAAFRNRFNCDGSYWLWTYEQRKTAAEFEHLISRVKDGTISVPLNTLVSCYGAQPVEGVLRGLYYAGRLERRYDLRLPMAVAMENQTLPLGLASLFAGAGAQYSWRGVCGCASKIPAKTLSARDHEIYWYTGQDGRRLLMKWYSLGDHSIGTYTEAGAPGSAIKNAESRADFLSRYADPKSQTPYAVVGLFGFGGDDLARKTGTQPPPAMPAVPGLQKVVSSPYVDHFTKIAKEMTTPRRQVIVSNEVDFFKDFESRYGDTLSSRRVTSGNEWDLYSASMSETSARVKRSVEKLRSAELLATLVSLKYPDFTTRFSAERDRAFNSLGLYWEHDWTADGPISRGQRAAWQELQAAIIESYVDSIQAEAVVRLGGMIPRPEKSNRFFVVNPLGWTRSDFADFAYSGSRDIYVRDVTSGKDVPHQSVTLTGATAVRIRANDVPSAGYKVFEILPGKGDAPADDAATGDEHGGVLENAAVKLVVDHDGAIRNFIDKRDGNAELATEIGGLKVNDLAANSDAGEPFRIENRGPVSVTLRARSAAGLDHTTEITLYRDSERVDIRNEINANFSGVRYWSFGFALPGPAVHTEEVGAINLDKLESAGGDYANTHARYDHVTLNHFADITNAADARGVTISNADLAFAKLGNSTADSLDTQTPQVNVLAGGQVDGSWLGIRAQNGNTHFLQRFALRPHGKYDPVAAMKFALEHQNPLVTGPVISGNESLYPADSYSLLTVTDPGVLVWAIKPAEEGIGAGVIVRLWNVANTPAKTMLTLSPGIASAKRTTHIETNLESIPVADGGMVAEFAPQQLQTYRLMPAAKVDPR